MNNIIEDWLNSETTLTRDMFDDFKNQINNISAANQLLFIKKVVNEIAKKNILLTIDDLLEIKSNSLDAIHDLNSTKIVDYSLDLILQTLKIIDQRQKFPQNFKDVSTVVKDLSDFICDYLENNTEYLSKINLLFDNCPGRTAIVNKSPAESYVNLKDHNYKIYNIYKGYSIINPDNTGWGDLVLHYEKGIYAKGKVCMLEITHKQTDDYGIDDITYGTNIKYNGKLYPFNWKTDNNNYLITPDSSPVENCEGRKSPSPCNLSGKDFWWCYGRKCFEANQSYHTIEEWKNYSLKDLLKILELPFDETGYYLFVSEINRLNRLLDRIKCNDCQQILRPSKEANFGFYRVSHFHCNNDNYNGEKCPSFHKEIYLTHCLNSKCTNVIDDRVAERCPNGYIICDKCGSCCSNEQFTRRIQSLETNGQRVPQGLIKMLNNSAGHWEKAECYCYRCKKEMLEDRSGDFVCKDCEIQYNRYNVYIRFSKNFTAIKEEKQRKDRLKRANDQHNNS